MNKYAVIINEEVFTTRTSRNYSHGIIGMSLSGKYLLFSWAGTERLARMQMARARHEGYVDVQMLEAIPQL